MQRWGAIVAHGRAAVSGLGPRAAESVSGGVGTWRFVGAQALVMALWVAWNVIGPRLVQYDRFPFTFLNLAMSAEAAFTGPILLISAKLQEKRAQAQIDRMEQRQIGELAQLKALVSELHAHSIGGVSVRQRDPKTGRYVPVSGKNGKAAA